MSQRFTALFQNYAVVALFSGGSWLAALPLNNLKDQDVGTVARSTNPLNASTLIDIDLGAARTVGGFALTHTNVSPGATYRFRLFSDAARTVTLADSMVKSVPGAVIDWSSTANWLAWEDAGFWYGIPDVFDQPALPVNLAHVFAADVSARYCRVEIFDANNAAGYDQAGYLLIGRAFRPSLNYAPDDNSFTVEKLADTSETLGGRRTYWNRAKRRALRVSFQLLDESEMFADVFRLNMLDEGEPIFVIPDPDDTANFQKRSFLATLKTPPPIALANVARGKTALDLEEVL